MAPEPPLPESDRIVPVARVLVNVFEIAPVVCAVERVNEVADAIFATDLVKELDRAYGNTPTATTAPTAQPTAAPEVLQPEVTVEPQQ